MYEKFAECIHLIIKGLELAPPMVTLQHATTRCNTLQYAATRCNTLQHVATRYNALQHTATHV